MGPDDSIISAEREALYNPTEVADELLPAPEDILLIPLTWGGGHPAQRLAANWRSGRSKKLHWATIARYHVAASPTIASPLTSSSSCAALPPPPPPHRFPRYQRKVAPLASHRFARYPRDGTPVRWHRSPSLYVGPRPFACLARLADTKRHHFLPGSYPELLDEVVRVAVIALVPDPVLGPTDLAAQHAELFWSTFSCESYLDAEHAPHVGVRRRRQKS